MLDFERLQYPNYLTHRKLRGISGKIMSISFIWCLVVACVTTGLVTGLPSKLDSSCRKISSQREKTDFHVLRLLWWIFICHFYQIWIWQQNHWKLRISLELFLLSFDFLTFVLFILKSQLTRARSNHDHETSWPRCEKKERVYLT